MRRNNLFSDPGDLPIYTATEAPPQSLAVSDLDRLLTDPSRDPSKDIHLWQRFLDGYSAPDPDPAPGSEFERARLMDQCIILQRYFGAISNHQQNIVGLLVEKGLVTANSKFNGQTPLFKAVETRDEDLVLQLLSLGAEVDEFSTLEPDASSIYPQHYAYFASIREEQPILRTPLQLAASIGHLTLVKLLIEQFHADEGRVANDGQIALRLAAENGHREVVDYLPLRRTGGLKRWKFKNRKHLRRARKACAHAGAFVKFFVWDVEKFFLWTVPKHVLVKPLIQSSKWLWEHKKGFVPWCVRVVKSIPRVLSSIARGVWKFISKDLPAFAKDCWKVLTHDLPEFVWEIVKWIGRVIARIPAAITLISKWIANGLVSIAKTAWNLILKLTSLLVTAISAIVNFFRNLTLKDIWNGFLDVLTAIWDFVLLLGSWVQKFGDGSWKLLKLLFGGVGECFWYLGVGILWLVTFLPRQAWEVLKSIGASFAKGMYEVKVWLNPKAT